MIGLYAFWLPAAHSQRASWHFRRPGSQGRRRYVGVDISTFENPKKLWYSFYICKMRNGGYIYKSVVWGDLRYFMLSQVFISVVFVNILNKWVLWIFLTLPRAHNILNFNIVLIWSSISPLMMLTSFSSNFANLILHRTAHSEPLR